MTKRKPAVVNGLENREVLSREQTMAFLGVSHGTLAKLIVEGLPVTRAGKRMLFIKTEVVAFLKMKAISKAR